MKVINQYNKNIYLILIFSIDINECENSEVCGEHQICNNTIGSYTVSLFKI